MSKKRSKPGLGRGTEAAAAAPVRDLPDRLDNLALWLVVCVVGVRPLLPESLDNSLLFAVPIENTVGLIGPGVSLGLNLLLLLVGVLWLTAGALRGRIEIHRHWGFLWAGLWIAGAAIAVTAASNKRSAINGAADLAAGLLGFFLLLHLSRTPWQRRLVVGVVLAGAAAVAVKCLVQWAREFDEVLERWQQTASVQYHSDHYLRMTEVKIRSHEPTGFFYHPNICAAYLMLCLSAAIGLTLGKWFSNSGQPFRRYFAMMGLPALAVMLIALSLTGGLGAQLGLAAAIFLMAVAAVAGPFLHRHRRLVIAAVAASLVVGTVALIGHGVAHGKLPGYSLTYRWYYWTAGWRSVQDHWLTGIGRQQFGPYFLLHKPPPSPEDVKNVHNVYLASLVECGPVGGIGVIGFVSWLIVRISRPNAPGRSSQEQEVGRVRNGGALASGRPLAWTAAVGAGTLGLILLAMWGPEPGLTLFLIAQYGLPALVFILSLAVFLFDENRVDQFAADELRWLRLCTACGLVGFLIQDAINFALYEPGPFMTFAALAAVCASDRADSGRLPTVRMGRPGLAAAGGLAVWAIAAALIWLPAARAGRLMRLAVYEETEPANAAKENRPSNVHASLSEIVGHLQDAAQGDPLDPMPLVLLARQYTAAGVQSESVQDQLHWWGQARDILESAAKADPLNPQWSQQLAELYERLFDLTGNQGDLESACREMASAARRNPTNSRFHVKCGDLLTKLWTRTGRDDLRLEAIEAYRQAIRMAQALPQEGEYPRLDPHEEVPAVQRKIDRLLARAGSRPTGGEQQE